MGKKGNLGHWETHADNDGCVQQFSEPAAPSSSNLHENANEVFHELFPLDSSHCGFPIGFFLKKKTLNRSGIANIYNSNLYGFV